ncbi:hypothetical protein MML48_2g00019796 [Holotrichia oblita]|uniref:Uncharacterized protein n=2 Tax=Holotrichia oblita TaxID=644536 RepID=A0ACB9TMW9_HOLOL|nr:hypothetical protein MML48_2g00012655 [Holotrichia oblita]KAI4468122.1 hypothetical protein MML48_2g00019796 [Holotrichia oblita]
MENADKGELQLAKEKNNVDINGVGQVTIYADGGWSKRSYGHTYNAASGVAVIIGNQTEKLLFFGMRNKYCSVCARAKNIHCQQEQHNCFKTWSGTSSGMKADILVDGSNKSVAYTI